MAKKQNSPAEQAVRDARLAVEESARAHRHAAEHLEACQRRLREACVAADEGLPRAVVVDRTGDTEEVVVVRVTKTRVTTRPVGGVHTTRWIRRDNGSLYREGDVWRGRYTSLTISSDVLEALTHS